MTNSEQQFHSGKRLQKLRELQGLSISELAAELVIQSQILIRWENEGVPSESIQLCSHYFEVSASLFSAPVNNQTELTQLIESQLFPQYTDRLQALLQDNQSNQSALLDLSGIGLSEIPTDVFGFTWLKALNISDNKLTQIPSQIVLLQQLEVLDISNNLLQHIPGTISSLINLTQLNFRGNPLTLQSTLLELDMTLDAYRDYLTNENVAIAVLEKLTPDNLLCLDEVRNTIEQTQTLIITNPDASQDLATKYKHISSIVFIAENHIPEQLEMTVKSVLQHPPVPLFILFNDKLSDLQHSAINSHLATLYPKNPSLIKLVDDKDKLSQIFNDVQRSIIYQDQLPCVKFESLILNNIGVYEHLEIALNPELTVLIGLNGAGKSTILKALTLATLGPEHAEIDANSASNLLRIAGMQENQTCWQPQGSIKLRATVNGKPYENSIHLIFNPNTEKVDIKGSRFNALFNADGHLINLMLGIGEKRNTNLKQTQTVGLEVLPPKARDLLPIISNEEQTFITHFTSWLGNLALSVSQGKIEKQQIIDVTFAIFSALMQESVKFSGLTNVEPLELWVEHQNPKQLVPLRLASQGYQAVMGWVGFIIQRMFEAYTNALQPLEQPAIIIIDEIDQLLHVKWQQKILNILAKEFFPNTQWIVTTHSPMVITGLDQEQVIQLRECDGKLVAEPNAVDLWLWQYGDVLRYLFEVSPEKPHIQEQHLLQNIAEINSLSASQLTDAKRQELKKFEQQLEKVQKSRAFIDEVYAEQQNLRAREQELASLIEKLSHQQKKD